MNLWIETTRDSLVAAISEVDCLLFNDSEIRMLTEEPNLARAARAVMDMGPRFVVAKRGEYGAVLFTPEGFFALPAFLLEDVRDPTGAGDSFATAPAARAMRSFARRWRTGRCSPRTTSRNSAPSGSPG
jgi:sugar/nucleoside kinase (ribokinase family)